MELLKGRKKADTVQSFLFMIPVAIVVRKIVIQIVFTIVNTSSLGRYS
ncbi:MAG: hypothetical protein R2758_08755 [Bacteroidales bacterium]